MSRRSALIAVLAVAAALGAALGTGVLSSSGAPGRATGSAARPPVVMIVFDEFPLDTLRGPDRRIDRARYPNFAALADRSTWFANAYSVYDSTPLALPAIMDGRRPRAGRPRTAKGHPDSIFTLFAARGYRVVASEESTAVCPPRVCGGNGKLPPVLRYLNGGRPERLARWMAAMRSGGRPTLYFKDTLLPHGPWIYLPSGKQTRPGFRDPVPGLSTPAGFNDRSLTANNEQRYLLQLAFADRELGKLLARLKATGLYDRALVVAAADHGFSFQLGVKDRRKVSPSNVQDIAPVPLFVKAPGQTRGAVNRSYVQTIDILPTIAGILGVRLPWRADGRSAFSAAVRRRRAVRLPTRDFRRVVSISARAIERRRMAGIRARAALFGTGASSARRFGDPYAEIFRIGPNPALLGRPVASIPAAGRGRLAARIAEGSLRRAVNPRSRVLPIQVAGRIAGGRPGERRDLAVAINGRIAAVGRSFYLSGGRTELFSMLVPESALRPGRNSTQVFAVDRAGRLAPIASG